MVQRSAKRPAVRVRWQFSDALYKQNAPISGSEISGKAPAGQTCPCRAQPGNSETLERIEEIIQKVKGMLTEIAVVDYKQTA